MRAQQEQSEVVVKKVGPKKCVEAEKVKEPKGETGFVKYCGPQAAYVHRLGHFNFIYLRNLFPLSLLPIHLGWGPRHTAASRL